MDFKLNNGPPCTVLRCSDLDLTENSSVKQNGVLLNHDDSSDEHDISVTSSIKELIRFEELEDAAETHESFMSTVSYANRLWTSKQFPLMPPSYFEDPSETEKNISYDTGDEIENQSQDLRGEEFEDTHNEEDQSANQALDLIDGRQLFDHKTAGPELDPETDDNDDDDTRSLASLSLFHESLPVVMSTPSAKMTRKKVSEKKVTDVQEDVRESLPPSNLVRKLFPVSNAARSPIVSRPVSPDVLDEMPIRSAERMNFELRREKEKSPTAVPSTTLRDARMNTARLIHVGDGVIMKELQDKLGELKSEIAKFKLETSKLTKARLECDAAQKQLTKDQDRFSTEADTRLRQIEEIHRGEMKKLEMEKKILYKHVALQKQDESRRLAETNQDLLTEIGVLREESKKAEGRHQGVVTRLRERIKSLESENDRLKDKADALAEDKQELIREVVRLSKRGSGASFPAEERIVQSPTSPTESSPRRNPPQPTERQGLASTSASGPDSASSDLDSSAATARTSLRPPDKISSPKNVHFDPESVNQMSFNEESFADEKIEASGTIEQTFKNGRKVRIYKNGTKKEISRDGKCSTTTYFNGDVRQVLPNKEVYFYAANQTVHTVYAGGTEVFEFANNQTEKIHPDGSKEVQYPNLMVRTVFPNGDEQCKYPDGSTEQWSQATKTRTLNFSNGEEEIHTEQSKKRIFPDGTQKIQYPDGRLETRYATGRIRIKDAAGKLVFDTGGSLPSAMSPGHQTSPGRM